MNRCPCVHCAPPISTDYQCRYLSTSHAEAHPTCRPSLCLCPGAAFQLPVRQTPHPLSASLALHTLITLHRPPQPKLALPPSQQQPWTTLSTRSPPFIIRLHELRLCIPNCSHRSPILAHTTPRSAFPYLPKLRHRSALPAPALPTPTISGVIADLRSI
jgi:hypothetical protein